MLKDNLNRLFEYVKNKNPYGEKVLLCGATKTQPAEVINQAISLGLTDVGENKAQEFRDKFDKLLPVNYHFFGRLQKNKVKYLIGKAYLIHSVDSLSLAEEISSQSVKSAVNTSILIEVNLGEEQKGGFNLFELENALKEISKLPNLSVLGLMTILPQNQDIENKRKLCLLMREKYDILKKSYPLFKYLSMGMSQDYQLCVDCGSNLIRVGTGIFGQRN